MREVERPIAEPYRPHAQIVATHGDRAFQERDQIGVGVPHHRMHLPCRILWQD
jgi:hypothetical protein